MRDCEKKQAPVVVGIDLGTTMSLAAHYDNGKVIFIKNDLGETLTPSVVAYDSRSKGLVVGRTAKEIWVVNPELGVASFKSWMGREKEFSLAKKSLGPIELSAYVLDRLKRDIDGYFEQPVDRCVITVPAYFSESQRQATKQAAEMAGFLVERILNEPTAAAIAYGLHQQDEEKHFVVLDLGGGTFDVCVMELFEGLLEVKGVSGVSQLGGEDFTAALYDHVLRRADINPSQLNEIQKIRLYRRAEMLKRSLTQWERSDIQVPTGVGEENRRVEYTRQDAERAFKPLLEQMIGPCRSALQGARLKTKDLTDVILVGGATRMPCIKRFAEEVFGLTPKCHEHPDHVVATGAAIQGAFCARDTAVEELVVTDVCSHTLGIAIIRTINGRSFPGYFSPIIERNTVIPTTQSSVFTTTVCDQPSILVEVFEGESRKTEENLKLGEFEVFGIPPGDPREAVEVRFTFDVNGILEVEVTVLETKKKHTKIFQRGNKILDGRALERARDKLRRLKADPKERPMHRDLLARAEALWAEISGWDRENFNRGIDVFEAALHSRDAKEIAKAYENLVILCEQYDRGDRW